MKHMLIFLLIHSFYQQDQIRQNFIVDFDIKELKQITQQHKYVVTGYIDKTTFDSETVINAFTEMSVEYLGNIDIMFLMVNVDTLDHLHFEEYNITQKNEIHLFIENHQKKFQDMIQTPILRAWLQEILQSNVQMISKMEQAQDDKNFNFVYAKSKVIEENSKQIKLLSEMITPLKLYTGLSDELENKLLPEGDVFVYRKYKTEFIKIDFGLNTKQIAQEIDNKKFPDYLEPDQDSYDLIINQQIPALIYYCQDMEDEIIEVLKIVSKQYREYLVLLIVNSEKHDGHSQFFREVMGVKYSRQLRILNNHQDFKRYKFIGQLEANLIDFFIENYLHSNIRSYSISENITDRYDFNIRNFNAQDMRKLHAQKVYVIYVYGGTDYDDKNEEQFQSHLDLMHELANEYQKNHKFVFGIINRNMNDIKEIKIQEVPQFLIYQDKLIVEKQKGNTLDKEQFKKLIQQYPNKDEL